MQLSQVLWLEVSQEAAIKVSVWTAVDSRLDWGRIHLQVLSVVLGRIQLLTGVWTEDLSSLLAGGQRPSSVPGHMGLSMGKLTTWQLSSLTQTSQKVREGVLVRQVTDFWNQSHLERDSPLPWKEVTRSSPNSKGKGLSKGVGTRSRNHQRPSSMSAYPNIPCEINLLTPQGPCAAHWQFLTLRTRIGLPCHKWQLMEGMWRWRV